MNVLIIGGSSDIGKGLTTYLLDYGYNVVVTYHKNKFEMYGADTIHCDVRDENEVNKVINYVINKYGRIDILINLAAISLDNSFLNKTKKEFMDVLEVNLVGTFLVNQAYARYIDNGMIINMASTDGIDTYSEYSMDYSASKAGIINLSKNIANSTNNKVICICPNWILSDSTRSMSKEYLDSELERIGQSRLITIDELNESIYKIINMNSETGSVFRIDIKGGSLCIEKM